MSPFMGHSRASLGHITQCVQCDPTWALAPHPAQLRYPDIHQYLTTEPHLSRRSLYPECLLKILLLN